MLERTNVAVTIGVVAGGVLAVAAYLGLSGDGSDTVTTVSDPTGSVQVQGDVAAGATGPATSGTTPTPTPTTVPVTTSGTTAPAGTASRRATTAPTSPAASTSRPRTTAPTAPATTTRTHTPRPTESHDDDD